MPDCKYKKSYLDSLSEIQIQMLRIDYIGEEKIYDKDMITLKEYNNLKIKQKISSSIIGITDPDYLIRITSSWFDVKFMRDGRYYADQNDNGIMYELIIREVRDD